MTLREAILDSLVDDGETIKQINEYLIYLGILTTERSIIEILNKLLEEEKIIIVFPENINLESLLDCEYISDLWFELTQKGYEEWETIR